MDLHGEMIDCGLWIWLMDGLQTLNTSRPVQLADGV